MKIPHLEKIKSISTLYVDERPYFAMAGEVHNSSASSLAYMREKVWPNLRKLHINTLLLPVSWELLEPKEDCFEFSLLDGLLLQARKEKIRLVLLWFGLWKNGESNYTPGWIKRDTQTYFRARYADGRSSNTISPLCKKAVRADAKAFRALMRHLREADSEKSTVIMVQVENEIGFLNSDRDYSPAANAEFEKDVPKELADTFGKTGNWEKVFGTDAAETFMAYHYASAVEQIAHAGAQEYALPFYVNAWLEQYPDRAGFYPSGGPIAKMMKIWKPVAPSISIFAPDIYVPQFASVCDEYTAMENPLFIPEARGDVASVSNVFYAAGRQAVGYSVFGIEDLCAPDTETNLDIGLLMALNIDVSAMNTAGTAPYLSESYRLLGNIADIINKCRGTANLTGFVQNGKEGGCLLPFGKYDLKISYKRTVQGHPMAGGLVIQISGDEFLLAGMGFTTEFLPKPGDKTQVGYIKIEEGIYENGRWQPERRLNGDEGMRIGVGDHPSAIKVELYQF